MIPDYLETTLLSPISVHPTIVIPDLLTMLVHTQALQFYMYRSKTILAGLID